MGVSIGGYYEKVARTKFSGDIAHEDITETDLLDFMNLPTTSAQILM